MSWLFSRALVAEYSAASCSDGEPSAPLSGNPTQLAYLPPDKMTAFSRPSRFGMTFRPLTAVLGEAVLMSYLAGFPAKTSALPAKEQESPENAAECGDTWRGSLARFDPVSSLWKTVQHSLLEDSASSSVTWPRSGMTAGGQCWELPTLGRHINETGSGLWPTPTVCGNYNRKGASATSGDGLATAVKKWPTPTVNDSKNSTLPPSQIKHDNIPGAMLRDGQAPGGQLNPTWVEWLMGWPLGWADLKPLEMDKSPCAPQQLGDS